MDPSICSRLRLAAIRLRRELKPRLGGIVEHDGQFTVQGIIGSIDVGSGLLLNVAPKTEHGDDWIHAVLDLLVGADRIDVAGERAAGLSPQRRTLLDVLAAHYAARLERALRRDGPILILEREHATVTHLKGKLDGSRWLKRAMWRPHEYDVAFNRLTPDNEISRAMSFVAQHLATAVRSPETRGRLLSASRGLRPGLTEVSAVPPAVATRDIPNQWAIYNPVWSIAQAVIRRRSLFGSTGVRQGLSVAIEAWPLLERLLDRALAAAVHRSKVMNDAIQASPKRRSLLLDPLSGPLADSQFVEPDGRLERNGLTLATFDAKYKRRSGAREWPSRADIHQAIATAAACASPLAVLVYPESFPTAWWSVRGTQGHPAHLAAIGMGLFGYRSGPGDDARGQMVLNLFNETPLAIDPIGI